VFKKNKQNVDDDIVSTSNTLSLQCPVSKKKKLCELFFFFFFNLNHNIKIVIFFFLILKLL